MPDAQEVLDKGIVTTANKPMDILIEELDANTQYVVLAAAKGEEENVLASVKIATKAFSVPDKKHTLISITWVTIPDWKRKWRPTCALFRELPGT